MAPYWRGLLRDICLFGAALVLLVPAARGHHDWLGWLPLWLLAMPALACWVAHGAPWPRLQAQALDGAHRRRGRAQARRRRGFGGLVTTGRGQPRTGCASVRGQ